MLDNEHQVTIVANGHVNPIPDTDGPSGSFNRNPGTKVDNTQWAPLPKIEMRPIDSQLPPGVPQGTGLV